MKYLWALLIVLTCLIPVLIGLGFGWDALLKYCTNNSGCDNDEVCLDNQCVYACKDKGCPQGATCVASNHVFACKCPSGFDVSPNDTIGVCRVSCNTDTDCSSTETCQLGVCMNACSMYVCEGKHTTALAYNHRCTCECLPKFRPNFNGECTRIPVCSVDQDCYYSERCSFGRCISVCLGIECFPSHGCIAHNHTYVCGSSAQLTPGFETQIKYHQRSVSAPLAQEILLNILAYSTLHEPKVALSKALHLQPDDFNWPTNSSNSNLIRVKNLVHNFSMCQLDDHALVLYADGELSIEQVAAKLDIPFQIDTDPKLVKFELKQVINFIIFPAYLQTKCITVDDGAATMTLTGNFITGQLIATNFKFVAIPYKVDAVPTMRVVFIYSETSEHQFSNAEVQNLTRLQPHTFFSKTNSILNMDVTIPMNLKIETDVDVGKTFLQPVFNLETIFFKNSVSSTAYALNEYAIYQYISIAMDSVSDRECDRTANSVALDRTDFAMFIVSEESTYFQAFYPSSE